MGIYLQLSHFCSLQGSQLSKTDDYFFPRVAFILPSSTIKASQTDWSFHVITCLISPYFWTQVCIEITEHSALKGFSLSQVPPRFRALHGRRRRRKVLRAGGSGFPRQQSGCRSKSQHLWQNEQDLLQPERIPGWRREVGIHAPLSKDVLSTCDSHWERTFPFRSWPLLGQPYIRTSTTLESI